MTRVQLGASSRGVALGAALGAMAMPLPTRAAEVSPAPIPAPGPPSIQLRCEGSSLYTSAPAGEAAPGAQPEGRLPLPDGTRCVPTSAGAAPPLSVQIGPVLYVALQPSGILLVDAAKHAAPYALRVLSTEQGVTSLSLKGSLLIAELKGGGVRTYGAADPYSPKPALPVAPAEAAPSPDHVTVTLIGDRPLLLRARSPLNKEEPLPLQNEPGGGLYVSKVRLPKDRRYRYTVSGEGAPGADFRAPSQEGAELRVYPGSTRKRNAGIALMALGGPAIGVGVGILVAAAFGALVIGTLGGSPGASAGDARPYLIGGGLSLLGGAILEGAGGALLASGRTILKLPPEAPPRVTLLPGRLWLSGRGLVF